jgi:hypothetical protein
MAYGQDAAIAMLAQESFNELSIEMVMKPLRGGRRLRLRTEIDQLFIVFGNLSDAASEYPDGVQERGMSTQGFPRNLGETGILTEQRRRGSRGKKLQVPSWTSVTEKRTTDVNGIGMIG